MLAAHPDLEEELREFLATEKAVEVRVEPLRGVWLHEKRDDVPACPGPFGEYDLLEEIARGGMGVVFRAYDRPADRDVAVKLIRAGVGAQPAERERFLVEARDVAGLAHPHIVSIYGVGVWNDHPYFSMELASGTLASRGESLRPWPRKVAALMRDVTLAVDFANRRGFIHRDLKPANVLLTADDVPKVADFGLAKRTLHLLAAAGPAAPPPAGPAAGASPEGKTLTAHGPATGHSIEGTPEYMAPEQARGARRLTAAVDVYGLGAILYGLLAGRPPFRGATPAETLRQVLEDPVVPPRNYAPKTDRDLEAICLKCLAKTPEGRYATAAAVAEDLERFLEGRPVKARPLPMWGRLRMWVRRQPPVLATAVALLTAVLFTVLAWQAVLYVERRAEEKWRSYARSVALADRIIATRQMAPEGVRRVASAALDRADEELIACPADQIGWEWHYLRRMSHRRQVRLVGHEGPVVGVRFSSRGVLTGAEDGTARLWDPETGAELVPPMRGHPGEVRVCFDADRSRVLTAGTDQNVLVWDAATGRRVGELPGAGDLAACDTSGRWIATVGRARNMVRLHDPKTLKEVLSKEAPFAVVSMALSPDGRYIALGGFHTEVVVWEIPSLRAVKVDPHGQKATVWALAFSSKGRHLAASLPEPVLFAVPDERSPSFRFVRKFGSPGSQNPASLDFSPDGQLLAAPFRDGLVRVWEVSTGRTVRAPTRHDGVLLGAAFGPEGEALAVTRGRDVTVETLYSREVTSCHELRGPRNTALTALGFSADGRSLASRAGDGEIVVWDTKTRAVLLRGSDTGPGGAVLFHRDRLLADGGGHLHAWDAASGAVVGYPTPAGRHRCLAAAPRGPLVAGSAGDNRIIIRNIDHRTEWEFTSATPGIQALAVHPDGKRVASCGTDGTVHIQGIDDARRAAKAVTMEGHIGTVHGLAFSRDGTWLASGGADTTIHLWRVGGTAPERVLRGHGGVVTGVAFHPDGKRLASCGEDGAVKVWDVRTGTELVTLIDHGSPFTALAFSPDGHLLAACCQDGAVRLWDGTPR